jgi:hypothetical protein
METKSESRDGIMAKVIEFYVPDNFRKKAKWISPEQRGKVIGPTPDDKTPRVSLDR